MPDIAAFQKLIRAEGKRLWRDLPWRHTTDPYEILVSEIMLQQTQVKRVLRYWPRFIALFPTIDALAAAETSLVLEMWQGLGYNRRALALFRLAQRCAAEHAGRLPERYEELLSLPGVGPATAGGVMAFAYDAPCVYLETNVRSVFLHHFFEGERDVADKQLIPLIEAACPAKDVRGWYYALLDYGAFLKASIENPSRKSKHHVQQSAFVGSRRQKRAELLRLVLGAPGISAHELLERLNEKERAEGREALDEDALGGILAEMEGEGFFAFDGKGYRA